MRQFDFIIHPINTRVAQLPPVSRSDTALSMSPSPRRTGESTAQLARSPTRGSTSSRLRTAEKRRRAVAICETHRARELDTSRAPRPPRHLTERWALPTGAWRGAARRGALAGPARECEATSPRPIARRPASPTSSSNKRRPTPVPFSTRPHKDGGRADGAGRDWALTGAGKWCREPRGRCAPLGSTSCEKMVGS